VGALLGARVGGGDQRRGGRAFGAQQAVELGARLAYAHHHLAVGEDHVVGLAVGLELLFGYRHKIRGLTPIAQEASMPYTPIIPKGAPPPLAPYSPGARAGNTVYV